MEALLQNAFLSQHILKPPRMAVGGLYLSAANKARDPKEGSWKQLKLGPPKTT